MKRTTLLTLGAAGLFLLTSCGPKLHRYSCGGKKRCISNIEKIEKAEKSEIILKNQKAIG